MTNDDRIPQFSADLIARQKEIFTPMSLVSTLLAPGLTDEQRLHKAVKEAAVIQHINQLNIFRFW